MFWLVSGGSLPQDPGAKTMFYNPFGVDAQGAVATPIERMPPLQPINRVSATGARFRHCGIHYWLQTSEHEPVTQDAASRMAGRFTLHIRSNCNGFLTVWSVNGDGRELTPRDTGARWSGTLIGDQIYTVPGAFEFGPPGSADHLIIVWARSQTEVAHSAKDARERVKEMLGFTIRGRPQIVAEADESTKGEVGNYVVNVADAGVAAEIRLISR